MYYTVSDFYNTFKQHVTCLAGKGGLSRRISSVGILDYELVPGLKGKYYHSNFQEGQFVLSTFLYARENPFLIGEAVKHLAAKGASGLAIKNVFHLHIHETALRYAESRNFPIFVIDESDIYFEDMIFKISSRIRQLDSLTFVRRTLDDLFSSDLAEEEIASRAKTLNPSFENHHFAAAVTFDEYFSQAQFAEYEERFQACRLNLPACLFTMYENSLLFCFSHDGEKNVDAAEMTDQLCKAVLKKNDRPSVGISRLHYHLGDFKASLTEALLAARIARDRPDQSAAYEDLGSLQILLPFCRTREMASFSRGIMEKISEYDAENNGRLTETLQAFCTNGCSIAQTAAALSQHENTIRYRLDKISSLTGLDHKKTADLHQLSLACQIEYCRLLLSE